MLVVVVGVFLVVEFPLAVLFVVVIVQNSLRVEIIDAEMGDTASVFYWDTTILGHGIIWGHSDIGTR